MNGVSRPARDLFAVAPGSGAPAAALTRRGRASQTATETHPPPRRRRAPAQPVVAPPVPPPDDATLEDALRALPVSGFTRRRVAWFVGAAVTIWVLAVFARQVGEASAAVARADQIRADNAAMEAENSGLRREVDIVGGDSYIAFQARAFGLGGPNDHPFTLAPDVPPLPSNAPGSASLRVGAPLVHQDPLDSWLSLLFGP